jgi:hypothetical protein
VAQVSSWQIRASLVAAVLLGCGGGNGKAYTGAAIGLPVMIGATAIYRAQTGGCWANCSAGYACDRQRGLCLRSECIPACASNQTCFIEDDNRARCVDMLGAGSFGSKPSAALMNSAPVSSAAPAASSASPN